MPKKKPRVVSLGGATYAVGIDPDDDAYTRRWQQLNNTSLAGIRRLLLDHHDALLRNDYPVRALWTDLDIVIDAIYNAENPPEY